VIHQSYGDERGIYWIRVRRMDDETKVYQEIS
jgi:hypothetical protein